MTNDHDETTTYCVFVNSLMELFETVNDTLPEVAAMARVTMKPMVTEENPAFGEILQALV